MAILLKTNWYLWISSVFCRKKKQPEFLNAQNLTRMNDLAHFFDKNEKFIFFLFFLLFPLYFIVFLLFVFCSIWPWHSFRVTNSLLEKSWYKKYKLQRISCCRRKQNWKFTSGKDFVAFLVNNLLWKNQCLKIADISILNKFLLTSPFLFSILENFSLTYWLSSTGGRGHPLRQCAPLETFVPPEIWSKSNRKISITKEICMTTDSPLKKFPEESQFTVTPHF